MIYLNDPKTGKPSATLTMAVAGFAVINIKLLLSGVNIGIFTMAPFSGIEYAAALGALGSIYVFRKNSTIKKDKDVDNGS